MAHSPNRDGLCWCGELALPKRATCSDAHAKMAGTMRERSVNRLCRCGARRICGQPRVSKRATTCGSPECMRVTSIAPSGCKRPAMKRARKTGGYRGSDRDQLLAAGIEAQQGRCAVCRTHESELPYPGLVLDHCHTSGRARGVLCGRCNAALGMLLDSEERCLSLANYCRLYVGVGG